jgi:hypothetical protein
MYMVDLDGVIIELFAKELSCYKFLFFLILFLLVFAWGWMSEGHLLG